MKRIVAFLVLLCILSGLSGCEKEPAAGETWARAYNQRGAFSDKGYYFLTPGGFLQFVDLTSGTRVALCGKVDCLHEQEPDNRKAESCEARLIGASMITPLFFWDGHLYYILEDEYGLQVYRRNADGTGLKRVTALGKQYTEKQKDVTVYAYAVSNGFLYYNADVDGAVSSADGGNTVQWEGNYIGRLSLSTGKEELLLENSKAYMTLCAVKNNAVLFHAADVVPAGPDYGEERRKAPAYLQCWQEGEVSTLFKKTALEFPGVNAVDGGKVYYTASSETGTDTCAYDLERGKSEKVLDTSMRYIGAGYAFRLEPKGETWQLRSLPENKTLPNALSKDSLQVTTVSDRGFILKRTVEGETGFSQSYSYVSFGALADGLQETDLMTFYSHGITSE